jgi:hypothetical protein
MFRQGWYIVVVTFLDRLSSVTICPSGFVFHSLVLRLFDRCGFGSFRSCSFAIMVPSDHRENAVSPPSVPLATPTSAESISPPAEQSKGNDYHGLTDQTRYVSPSKIIMVRRYPSKISTTY